jgi:hypothetical protein
VKKKFIFFVEPIIRLRYCPDVEEKQGNQNFEQRFDLEDQQG